WRVMTGTGYTRKRQQTRNRLVAAGMVASAAISATRAPAGPLRAKTTMPAATRRLRVCWRLRV
ncbi:MAG: hypothetical protein AAFN30_20065, partial [Actinomycetota bacterium]